jgi:hypothetical protein
LNDDGMLVDDDIDYLMLNVNDDVDLLLVFFVGICFFILSIHYCCSFSVEHNNNKSLADIFSPFTKKKISKLFLIK